MKKDYLEIGKIVSTHALKGELRVQPWCDGADFIRQFKTLYFDKNGAKPVEVTACRPHGNIVILKLSGIELISEGGTFTYDNSVGNFAVRAMGEEKAADTGTIVQAAKLIISANVTITFEAE